MEWAYPLSGLVVGLIVGVTGVGGGSLMTPLLVLLFGVSPATAVGTDLLYAAITKAGGAVVHHRHNTVEWGLVGRLAMGSIPASLITILVLHTLDVNSKHFTSVITGTLGIALILTALALVFRERLRQLGATLGFSVDRLSQRRRAFITVAAGATLGALVTLSSVGAGALGVVALFFLYPRMAAVKIVGSDIAHAVPLTLVAGLGHASLGTVDYTLLGSLLIGSLPGIWIGSHLSARMPEQVLRPILATMLALIGLKFVL